MNDDFRVTTSEQPTCNGRADTTGTNDSDHETRCRSATIRSARIAPATLLRRYLRFSLEAQHTGHRSGDAENEEDSAEQGEHHGSFLVGLIGVEPTTSSLSGMRSNQLSYSPVTRGRSG